MTTKILIVEDDGTIVVRLEQLLQGWGYAVMTAESGEQALQLAAGEAPHLALMDIRLDAGPGSLDGIETAQLLHERFEIPSIYLTAYADDEYLDRARATEPYGYLVKPLQALSLRSTLDMALARVQVDNRLKALLQEREVLLHEVHHRVKNNMQTIAGLLYKQREFTDDARTRAILDDSIQRVQSMALIHEHIYRSHNLARINLAEYIRSCAGRLFKAVRPTGSPIDLTTRLEEIYLSVAKTIPVALILNELMTNALKYAFPDGAAGEIVVACSQAEGRVTLRVSDNGVGLPEHITLEHSPSLGLYLVYHLAVKQLGGAVEVHREAGSAFVITFPH